MTTTATPGLERLTEDELETISACAHNGQISRITPYEIQQLVDGYRSPPPAGGEVRALRDIVRRVAEGERSDAGHAALRDAALEAIATPAEAAQAGEATMAEQVERTKICSALRDAGLMLEPVPDGGGAWHYKVTPLPTPSREEGPTDEQVERALHGRVPGGSEVWVWIAQDDPFKPSETARDVVRAALKAAGPSAQQRVSEEMRDWDWRSRNGELIASSDDGVVGYGIYDSEIGLYRPGKFDFSTHPNEALHEILAALSPENGEA